MNQSKDDLKKELELKYKTYLNNLILKQKLYELANADLTQIQPEQVKFYNKNNTNQIRTFYWQSYFQTNKPNLNEFLNKISIKPLSSTQKQDLISDLENKFEDISTQIKQFLPQNVNDVDELIELNERTKKTAEQLQSDINLKCETYLNLLNELIKILLKLLQDFKYDSFLLQNQYECENNLKRFEMLCKKIDTIIGECVHSTYTQDKLCAFANIKHHIQLNLIKLKETFEKLKLTQKLYDNLDGDFLSLLKSYTDHKDILQNKKFIVNKLKQNNNFF